MEFTAQIDIVLLILSIITYFVSPLYKHLVNTLARKLFALIISFEKYWKPHELIKYMEDGNLADYNKIMEGRTDIKLTPEQQERADKLTKAHKLLKRNSHGDTN